MFAVNWEPVTRKNLAAFTLGFLVFLLLLSQSEPGFIFLLDHANLLFHEAGHPIGGLLSQRLEPYAGTIGQLVFPVVVGIGFYRRGQVLGFATAVIWFAENLFNIARYVADARKMALPVVGGGDHDWNTILSRWGWLDYDTEIGRLLVMAGWAAIALSCLWVLRRAWKDRYRAPVERFQGTALVFPDR